MGFMDKVKAAAQDVATQAKAATSQAQEKMEASSIRKKIDEAAKNLGHLVYRERTEGVPAGAEADGFISEMTSLRTQLDELLAAEPAPPEAPPAPAPPPADPQP